MRELPHHFLFLLATLFSVPFALSGCASHHGQLRRDRASQPMKPQMWVELGENSAVIARVITEDLECPKLKTDLVEAQMRLRMEPTSQFPVRVCEGLIPVGVKSASIGETSLALPVAHPKRLLFIGDTGCRLKKEKNGTATQGCNDPLAWPFAELAKNGAAWKPDLVVHSGDYAYREAPCPEGDASCAGSPWGDNWPSWDADFFTPARPLLESAPWVFVRGNHELCNRAGTGWFGLLEPRPGTSCSDYTSPYRIDLGSVELVILDSAKAEDVKPPADQVRLYAAQFAKIDEMPLNNAWLVSHKPLWAPAYPNAKDPKLPADYFNLTLEAASENELPEAVQLVMSGHLHLFEAMSFTHDRPAQIVAGNGGTKRINPVYPDPKGIEMAGDTVSQGATLDEFGYFTMEESKNGWTGTAYDSQSTPRLKCKLKGRKLSCSRLAEP
jgi:hypothetical protein